MMRHSPARPPRLPVLALLVGALVAGCSGGSDSTTVSGVISFPDEGSQQLAEVALLDFGALPDAQPLVTTLSELDGSFAIPGVPPGTYELEVRALADTRLSRLRAVVVMPGGGALSAPLVMAPAVGAAPGVGSLSADPAALPHGSTSTLGPAKLLAAGKVAMQTGQLAAAKAYFDAVLGGLGSSPSKPHQIDEAKFYAVFVDLALAFDAQGHATVAGAILHELLAGFGFPPGGPDLVFGAPFHGPEELPTDAPDCDEVLAYLRGTLVPQLEASRWRLSELPPSFVSQLVPVSGGTPIEIDKTDAFVAMMAFEAWMLPLNLLAAQGCGLDLDDVAASGMPGLDVLLHDPVTYGGFLPSPAPHPANLEGARRNVEYFVYWAVQAFDALILELQNPADDQADDLLALDPANPFALAEVQAWLADKIPLHASSLGATVPIAAGTGKPLPLNLAQLAQLDLRASLPPIHDAVSGPAVEHPALAYGPVLPPAVPPQTFNGLFPALSVEQANDWFELVVPFDAAPLPSANIAVQDGSTADWVGAAASPALLDPAGDQDYTLDAGVPFAGADVSAVHLAQDASQVYLLVKLADGAPQPFSHAIWATYTLELFPDDPTASLPELVAFVTSYGSGFTTEIYAAPFFWPPVTSGCANCAGHGGDFLEIRIPKADLAAVIPPGTWSYVLDVQTQVFDTHSWASTDDFTARIRFDLTLP